MHNLSASMFSISFSVVLDNLFIDYGDLFNMI